MRFGLMLGILVFCVGMLFEASLWGQKSASKFVDLNVATFNIRQAPSENSYAWQVRKNSVRDLIQFNKFDICGVQEAFYHQLNFIASDDYGVVGVGRDDGVKAGEHSAILFNRKKFSVLKSGTFWFSDTPSEVSLGWGARYKRICSWAEFKHLKSGKIFFVFNLHLDHESVESQLKSIELLLERKKSIVRDMPCVIMGDFNIPIGDVKMAKLAQNKSLSAVVNFPKFYGANFSYHDYMRIDLSKIPRDSSQHIDHIFVSRQFEILSSGVLTDSISQLPSGMKNYCDNVSESENKVGYPSDHFPVFSRLRLR